MAVTRDLCRAGHTGASAREGRQAVSQRGPEPLGQAAVGQADPAGSAQGRGPGD